ncbi:hypothetical protein B9W68_01025 [Streptomyces sp. CS227]|nr:hypothetical protein B9W68_01025 [Streptomyces sp. CS227]
MEITQPHGTRPYGEEGRGRVFMRFGVLGLEKVATAPDERGDIGHVEPRRPGGGGPVCGSPRRTGSVQGRMRAGVSAVRMASDGFTAAAGRRVSTGSPVSGPT